MVLLVRRLMQLYVGLALYGLGIAFQISSGLGNDPWDVFHQGLARHTGLSIGTWILIIGVLVMLLWIPIRQRPGLGTLSNALLVGVFADVFLRVVPRPHAGALQCGYLAAAVLISAVATGLYIGAGFGPGPRDGLTTGLAARGLSLRAVRTSIELSVLATGWLLGGTVGVGTVLYALAIGPLTHLTIPALTPAVRDHAPTRDHEPELVAR
jgi:uncharacterized membrane protein YczE